LEQLGERGTAHHVEGNGVAGQRGHERLAGGLALAAAPGLGERQQTGGVRLGDE